MDFLLMTKLFLITHYNISEPLLLLKFISLLIQVKPVAHIIDSKNTLVEA